MIFYKDRKCCHKAHKNRVPFLKGDTINMPKGKNQKMKLYRLYRIMLSETDEDHALTIKQIQERLAESDVTVDRKTLYEDFAALGEMGLDIEMSRNGNEYLYRVVSKRFELAELKLLVDAIQSSKFITAKKSRQLIGKLTDFASSYEARQLDRQVVVAGRVKTMNESIYYNVDAVHEAITENRQICFSYLQWNEDKQLVPRKSKAYRVSPWALTWNDGNYYLIAYDAAAAMIKNYRVDKMDQIKVLPDVRTGKNVFRQIDMAGYTRENFDMFAGKETMVTLRFTRDLVGVMIDRFGKEITICRVNEDHDEITVPVAVSGMFYGWAAGFGNGVEIVKPEEVRKEYCEKLKQILTSYS